MSVRESVVKLCQTFLRETNDPTQFVRWGEVGFDHIAKNYGNGSGTSCGFLPHWLLWRLGCRDDTLVNRAEPDRGLTYRSGENLSILQPLGGKHVRPYWHLMDPAATEATIAGRGGPQAGDFVIIKGRNWLDEKGGYTEDSAHIFVLLENGGPFGPNTKEQRWRIAQTGATTSDGLGHTGQGGHITTATAHITTEPLDQVVPGDKKTTGTNIVFNTSINRKREVIPVFPRRVIGWLNVEEVSWGAAPPAPLTELFERRRFEQAENNDVKIAPWLGWWVLDRGPGAASGPRHVLLHRGHSAYRMTGTGAAMRCTNAGLWVRRGNSLLLSWDDGRDELYEVTTNWNRKPVVQATSLVTGDMMGYLDKDPPGAVAPWRFQKWG